MVRIVSGRQQEDPNAPLLAGLEFGQMISKNRRQQQEAEMEVMKHMLAYRKEQARALAETNKRAQLGEVQAIQQQMMEAEAAQLPPDQARLVEIANLRQDMVNKGASPEALKAIDTTFADYTEKLGEHRQRQAAEQAIARAEKNGLVQPGVMQGRLAAGERPQDLAQEVGKLEMERNIQSLALKKNGEHLAQAEAAVQAMPEGQERLMAEYELEAYKNDVDAQSKPGTGAQMLKKVQEDLHMGQQQREAKEKLERAHQLRAYQDRRSVAMKQAGKAPVMPGLPGVSGKDFRDFMEMNNPGFDFPEGRSVGTHATVRTGIEQLADQAKDERELAGLMKRNGIPLNADTQAHVRKIFEGRRISAQAEGGADR